MPLRVVRYSLPFETVRGVIDRLADINGFNTELLFSQHKIRIVLLRSNCSY